MKYTELKQIAQYWQKYKKINTLKRIDDNIFSLNLDQDVFLLDLSRSQSGIYQAQILQKHYNAPFDVMLKKYFTNTFIKEVGVLPNNRILYFHTRLDKAYKSFENKIYFEFTGKNTNVIFTDEKDCVIQALRHIEKSYRSVEVGQKLEPLQPFKINEEYKSIDNFEAYFKESFLRLNSKRIEELKKLKLIWLDKKINQNKNILENLDQEEKLLQKAQIFAHKGDVLFANLYQLKDFQREFELLDFEGNKINFSIQTSPKFAATEYYNEAKKLKQKASKLYLQRQNLEDKIDFYQNLSYLIKQARSSFELEILLPKKERKEKKDLSKQAVASFYFNEFKILVGKNEKGNEQLLKEAKKDDLWLHVQNLPSAHTLIVSNKLKISDEVLEFAARLCVSFSGLEKGIYFVDYTQRKFVKIQQKAFVHYVNYKSISILKE